MTPIEQYIRERAPLYGVDPDIAVRVAQSEGGLNDPIRQSDIYSHHGREQSYGPFQLYMNGGVGARALAAGIDPRKESDWKGGVDFALAEAAQKGWGQWHGAKRVGIGEWEGIGKGGGIGPTGGTTLTSNPVTTPPAEGAPSAAPAANQSILDKLLSGTGSKDIASGLGGKQAPPMEPLQIPAANPHMPSPDAAAQLLASLLENNRKRYGLTLTGTELES